MIYGNCPNCKAELELNEYDEEKTTTKPSPWSRVAIIGYRYE